jgi:acetylornithine deacetylase/succinyl-diaminopimelate desuccinylase-like protein
MGFAYTHKVPSTGEGAAAGIEVRGKAAHAMEAEVGINAIARLCLALDAMGVESQAVRFVAREVGEGSSATRIFGECADEPSGKLKFNVGKIELGEVEKLSIDCRIPVTVAKANVVTKARAAAARYRLEYKEFDWLAPLYLPLDHFVIETLMRVYGEVSGDTVSQPIALGGATYARAIDNCAAFALTPGELLTEHQPNERAVLENLYRAMDVYAYAVYELAG